jgi:hypothetical protein
MATLDLQVAASADDCNKYYAAGWQFYLALGQSSLYVGGYDATYYQFGCGLRFLNVTIPQGATITAAYLTVTAWDAGGGNLAAQWYSKIRGQAADNAAIFSTLADFDARDWVVATPVAWSGNTAWTDDIEYQSPEIKTLIQAIVNRAGWTSGNALALSWDDFDNQSAHSLNRRCVWEYDGSTTKAVKLHIEYTVAKTSSDTGSGADAKLTGNPVATLSKTETGAGADAKSSDNPLYDAVKAETGSGVDALISYIVSHIRAETGSGIESLLDRDLILTELGSGLDAVVELVESEKFTSDSGVGTESLGDRVIALSSESGSGLEVVAQFLRFLNDAGSASEALSIIAAAIIKADVGSGGEEINISATLLAQIETATGIDASTLLAAFLKAETGSGTEELSQIITSIQGSDLGSGLETFVSLLANIWLYLGDSGVGTEQILDRAMVLISEAGLGADASVLLAGMTSDDVAAAIDASIAIVAALQRTEAGEGVDAAVDLLGILSASDIGTGTELSVLLAALIVLQSGIGTDAMLSLLAALTKTDVGSGIDATVELLTTRILSVAVITKAYRNVKAITYGG